MALIHSVNPAFLTRSGFSKWYAIDRTNFNDLYDQIATGGYIDNIAKLYSQPIDNIISVVVYPLDVASLIAPFSLQDEEVWIGNVRINGVMAELSTGPAVISPIQLASFSINPYFNNFLDYAPYTTIEVFLPYIGTVRLDNHMVMGKSLLVKYCIDPPTGRFTAYITTTTIMPDDTIVFQQDGIIGASIPTTGASGADRARAQIEAARSALTGTVQTIGATVINPVAGLITGAQALMNTVNAGAQAQGEFIHKGSAGNANTGFFSSNEVHLIITRPELQEPTSYAHTYGRPSGMTATLGTLTGFTQVAKVHVEGSGFGNATSEELAEIEQLLLEGVIL